MSQATQRILEKQGGFVISLRGKIHVKVRIYFLINRTVHFSLWINYSIWSFVKFILQMQFLEK